MTDPWVIGVSVMAASCLRWLLWVLTGGRRVFLAGVEKYRRENSRVAARLETLRRYNGEVVTLGVGARLIREVTGWLMVENGRAAAS